MRILKNIKLISLFMLPVYAVLLITGCSKPGVSSNVTRSVKVVEAAKADIVITAKYAGKLKPIEETTAASKIAGKVDTVNFNAGMKVKQGDILFTLEKKDVEVQYRQAKAAEDTAKANYIRTSDSSYEQLKLQAEQSLKQAQLLYDEAKKAYDKVKELQKAGKAAQQDVDSADSRLKSASIQLESAKNSLALLEDKGGPQAEEAAAAQLKQAEAAVKTAALQLENTVIQSPVTGVVAVRNIDPGEIIGAGTPAFIIINTDKIVLEVGIPEKNTKAIQKGQKVDVNVQNAAGGPYSGIVDSISPVVDARTQNFMVKINLSNNKGELKPGMFARVSLESEKKMQVLVVPNEAMIYESGLQYVYIVSEEKVRKVLVETGISDRKQTEILKGLEAGDLVITEGQNFLSEGDPVKMVRD